LIEQKCKILSIKKCQLYSSVYISQAQRNIPEKQNITFREMDIQATHLEDSLFDIVIANHMLYHVPNIETALKEVQRILKPNGIFYAATNGNSHMKEIYLFVKEFDSSLPFIKPVNSKHFGLENGEKVLRNSFKRVQLLKYESNLRVTNVQDLADYIFSIDTGFGDALNKQGRYDQFISFLESKKNAQGYIHISKDSGMYVVSEPY
jgi:SAM-dependent methyltransferase